MTIKILCIVFLLVSSPVLSWAYCSYNDYECHQRERLINALEQTQKRQHAKPYKPVFKEIKPYDIDMPNPGEDFIEGYQRALDIEIKRETLKRLRGR